MTKTAIYPGSFDPVTLGHIDIIERASRLVDRLVVAVGVHHGKKPLFDANERISLLEAEVLPISKKYGITIDVLTFDGLAVDFARSQGATIMVRGLRSSTDFNYEVPLAGMNGQMAPDVETVFLAASPETRHIEGSLVRQVAAMGGDSHLFVPPVVARALAAKFKT